MQLNILTKFMRLVVILELEQLIEFYNPDVLIVGVIGEMEMW